MENAQDLCAGIKRRLENLQEHSLVQLKNCKGPLDLHNDLVQEARQDIHIVEATLEVNCNSYPLPPLSRVWSDYSDSFSKSQGTRPSR